MMKRISTAVLAVSLCLIMTSTAFAEGFIQKEDKWFYEDRFGELLSDELKKVDGITYYFDNDGEMLIDSLFETNGMLYYADNTGKVASSEWKKLFDEEANEEFWYYFSKSGKAKESGWITIDGGKYHFTDYHMDYGWYTDDEGKEYFLGDSDDGKAASGWVPYKGDDERVSEDDKPIGWYYFRPGNNTMVSDTEKKIGTKYYAFSDNGLMIDGFGIVRNNSPISLADLYVVKYYEKSTGARASGWRWIEGCDDPSDTVVREDGWYYFKNGKAYSAYNNTTMISSTVGVVKIDNDFYAFDVNGKMVTGTVVSESDDPEYDGRYYYFDKDGRMKTGYVNVSEGEGEPLDDYMYFDKTGANVPRHGSSVTGIAGNYLYDNGVLVSAANDKYELVTISNGKTYVVSSKGIVKKSGTVTLDSGKKMKIIFDGTNYDWVEV